MSKMALTTTPRVLLRTALRRPCYVGERACAAEREEWRSVHVSIMMTYVVRGSLLKQRPGHRAGRSTRYFLPPASTMVKASDVILIIVAIIFPPAAAFIVAGCSCDLLINVLLTMYV